MTLMTKETITQKSLDDIERLTVQAGRVIMQVRERGYEHRIKEDGSPVTDADLLADQMFHARLPSLADEIPIITEETWQPSDDQTEPERYWCIDPLDGTRGFINGGKDFTVNIALIEQRHPVLGIIVAPARAMLWASDGTKAWKRTLTDDLSDYLDYEPITARKTPREHPIVVTDMAHRTPELKAWLERIETAEMLSVGSSLKLCLVAEGSVDLYPKTNRTMEWDTAAGQAIIESAGGQMIGADGTRFYYGKTGRINGYFSAMGTVEGAPPAAWLPPRKPQGA